MGLEENRVEVEIDPKSLSKAAPKFKDQEERRENERCKKKVPVIHRPLREQREATYWDQAAHWLAQEGAEAHPQTQPESSARVHLCHRSLSRFRFSVIFGSIYAALRASN